MDTKQEPVGKQITISQAEYDELVEDQKILNALRAGGVDNWDGYDDSLEYGLED